MQTQPIMASDFDKLVADIDREAQEEGPAAEEEWRQLRAEFRLANQLVDAMQVSRGPRP